MGKRGRPATPHCPTCVEEGIKPPFMRVGPGKKCQELHQGPYQTKMAQAWQKRQRVRRRAIDDLYKLVEWFDDGAVESCKTLAKDINDLRDQTDNFQTLLEDVPPKVWKVLEIVNLWIEKDSTPKGNMSLEELEDVRILQAYIDRQKSDPKSTP